MPCFASPRTLHQFERCNIAVIITWWKGGVQIKGDVSRLPTTCINRRKCPCVAVHPGDSHLLRTLPLTPADKSTGASVYFFLVGHPRLRPISVTALSLHAASVVDGGSGQDQLTISSSDGSGHQLFWARATAHNVRAAEALV